LFLPDDGLPDGELRMLPGQRVYRVADAELRERELPESDLQFVQRLCVRLDRHGLRPGL
jgi:hypothetical protein